MLQGKVILAVDDEPDVLEIIVEVLEMCRVDTAGSYEQAYRLLERRSYDMVVLDVMGVRGLQLLEHAVNGKFPAVMLTAPALHPEYVLKSMERGAISYMPKEDLARLDCLLTDLFAILERGESPWPYAMERLEPVLDQLVEPGWRERYRKLYE